MALLWRARLVAEGQSEGISEVEVARTERDERCIVGNLGLALGEPRRSLPQSSAKWSSTRRRMPMKYSVAAGAAADSLPPSVTGQRFARWALRVDRPLVFQAMPHHKRT
jgi:hypothetical protein